MIWSIASNRDGARTIRLQNIQGRNNFGHFFISNSIQLVHCIYIEEEELRCILSCSSVTLWWLVGWRQLHSVECDHRKQMEAKELKWGESRVNKLVQAGLCFFTKVNHEILAGTGQKCYWAFVNLFLADLWRSNSQLCTGWPQKCRIFFSTCVSDSEFLASFIGKPK